MYSIYLISNTRNRKVYIGRTNSFNRRKAHHLKKLKKNTHPNRKLQNFINKYGIDCLSFEIISTPGSLEDCLIQEELFIQKYDSFRKGFNMTEGGNKEKVAIGSVRYWEGKFGKNHNTSKVTYQYSLSGQFIKKWNSVVDIVKFYKFYRSQEISYCCSGKVKSAYGYYWSREFSEIIDLPKKNYVSRPVEMLDLNNKPLRTFDSGSEAARFLKKKGNKIHMVCSSKRETWAGFKWRYL